MFYRKCFTRFNRLYDTVYKVKTLAVSRKRGRLIGNIFILLNKGRGLLSSHAFDRHTDKRLKSVRGSGNGGDNGATKLFRERVRVYLIAFLLVYVTFVECDHHRNSKLKKLGGEEKAAAEVVSVHDIYNNVGVFLLYVGARNAFLTRKG